MYVTVEPTNDSVIVLDKDELDVVREILRDVATDEDFTVAWLPKSQHIITELANRLGVMQ